MRAFHTDTLANLHEGLIHRMVTAQEFDLRTGSDYQWHNVIARCDSLEYNPDLKHFWVDERRWNRLIREYLDPDAIEQWAEACSKVKNRVATLRLGVGVKSHANRGAKWRVWGACLLELAYRERPEPHLTLFSRTSYLGYLSVLDLTVPKLLAEYLPVDANATGFTWHVMAAQMSWMKALGHLLHQYPELLTIEGDPSPDMPPVLHRAYTQVRKLKQYDREEKHYGQMLYNPERRLRRRYHTEHLGYEEAKKWEGSRRTKRTDETYHYKAFKPLPSMLVQELTLDALRSE